MAKWQNDLMLDAALDVVSSNSIEYYVCSAQPANYAGIAAVALTGIEVPTFQANQDGDASGRKLVVDEEVGMDITVSGDATHVALASATVLYYVTTVTTQTLTSGGTVTIPTFKIELADAT